MKFVRWFFGICCIISGIGNMSISSAVGGLALILAGLLMLPPTFTFISQKTGKSFSRPVKYLSVIALIIISGIFVTRAAEKQQAAQKADELEKKKQEQLAYEKLPAAVKDSLSKVKAREDSIVQVQEARKVAYEGKKKRKEEIEAQFSAYDGSHRGVERLIKERMNDPDSYEHVATRYVDKGDHLAVLTQFRGKNAFGAKVLNTATAKVDLSGNVLSLEVLKL
ncbi:hypothetical protein [Hymenobacter pini]|uniref:hypothetical protein n=1 Tax=Hymenobacter pini TaxID=2880879 RepID=UPI001CF54EAB|nr:hypothetical protein [Hymenobacter pini]MCA8830570.1 hypothetical protein [Hymenobacter pini]